MENLNTTVLKKGIYLIRGISDYKGTPIYTIILNTRKKEIIIKALEFIKKYALKGYEVYEVIEDIELLDFPYASLYDCEEDPIAVKKLFNISKKLNNYVDKEYRENKINLDESNELKASFFSIFLSGIIENGDYKTKGNPDYVVDKFVCRINLNGWYRYACLEENSIMDEVMICSNGLKKLKKVNMENIKKNIESEIYDLIKLLPIVSIN